MEISFVFVMHRRPSSHVFKANSPVLGPVLESHIFRTSVQFFLDALWGEEGAFAVTAVLKSVPCPAFHIQFNPFV